MMMTILLLGTVAAPAAPHEFAALAAAVVARGSPVVLRETPVERWAARRWTPEQLAPRLNGTVLRAVFIGERGEEELTYFNESLPLVDLSAHQFFAICAAAAAADGSGERVRNAHYSASLGQWRSAGLHSDAAGSTPGDDPHAAFAAEDATVWMASAGVVSTTHFDSQRNFFAQLYGRKRFDVWPPTAVHAMELASKEDRVRGRSAPTNLDLAALDRAFPRQTFDLDPGDVLYIPPFWFHRVTALSTSISLSLWAEDEASLGRYRAAAQAPLPFERAWSDAALQAASGSFLARVLRVAVGGGENPSVAATCAAVEGGDGDTCASAAAAAAAASARGAAALFDALLATRYKGRSTAPPSPPLATTRCGCVGDVAGHDAAVVERANAVGALLAPLADGVRDVFLLDYVEEVVGAIVGGGDDARAAPYVALLAQLTRDGRCGVDGH